MFFYNSIFLTDTEEEDKQELDLGLLANKPVDKTRQDMHRHLKIYVPVISLIKDNIHIVESVKNKAILDLFRLCFAFLTAFVKQNESNQQILSNSIVVFLYNMNSNLGHVQLLNELFRDNYNICTAKAEEVIDDFFRLILANGRRAEYLEFFSIIQNVGGEMIYTNQRMVLNMFLDPKNKNLLLYLDQPVQGSPKKKQARTEITIDKKNFTNTFRYKISNEKFS